jgi:hypothetical protein
MIANKRPTRQCRMAISRFSIREEA